VPIRVYDETLRILKSAVEKAKLGQDEALAALRRLDEQSRRLERSAGGQGFNELIAGEFEDSSDYEGRSVFGWEPLASRKRAVG
jgi:hypothetical protein